MGDPFRILADTADGLVKFVGYPQVIEALGVSRSTVLRAVNDGELPAPRKIKNRSVWLASEINNWAKALFEGRMATLDKSAATDAEDLEADQMDDQALELIQKSLEMRTGQPVEFDALDVRVTRSISEDELKEAVKQEFSLYAERFSNFDKRRACVMAAWLFASLRADIENSAPGREKMIYGHQGVLEGFGQAALNDDEWEDLITRFDALG